MQSRRSSRDSSKSRSHRKKTNENNEVEEISSQSYADDSGDRSRRSYKTRRSSHSSKKDQRTDDDTEDNFSDIRRKKETLKKKKQKSESMESTEEILSDDEYVEKEESTSVRKKSRKRRKSTRTNESNSLESTGERDSSSKKDSAKSRRKKRQEQDKQSEVPITEILKTAQKQRVKYEEPMPLPELTASTVYVQDRNGFSAIKIPGTKNQQSSRQDSEANLMGEGRPIEAAIVFQKIWRSSGFIFQGLLGGMAVLHLIFMETYFENSEEFVVRYSRLIEIYGSCFAFLIAMCLISIFDKFDLAHIGRDHLHQILKFHLKSIPAFPLYIVAFSLHQITSKVEDKLTLIRYNSSNITYYSNADAFESSSNSYVETIGVAELRTWQRLSLSKDALAVLGWIFAALGNREDMLVEHLVTMSKYADDVPY